MTITTHAAVGAVVGQITGNIFLAFVAGLISHFLLDIIPHGDVGMSDNFRILRHKRKQAVAYSAIDGALAVFFILFLFNIKDVGAKGLFTWGIVGSVLPDLIVGIFLLFKFKWLRWFYRLHFYFHDLLVKKYRDIPLRYAVVAQALVVIFLQSKI